MCTSYSSYFTSTSPPTSTALTDLQLSDAYDYLLAARDTVVTESAADTVSNFAATAIGVASSKTITITNYRNLAVGFVPSITVNGTDFSTSNIDCAVVPSPGTGFSVAAADGTTSAPGTCQIRVTFSPAQGLGVQRMGTLSLVFAGNPIINPRTRTIDLTGDVTPATFGFTTGTTTFESHIGTPISVKVGTVRNDGEATLRIASVAVSSVVGATYGVGSPSGACATGVLLTKTGSGSASCEVWITFNPGQQITTHPTVTVTYQKAVGATLTSTAFDVTPAINGTGTQALINPTATTVTFGDVQQGVGKVSNLSVSNTGNEILTFSGDATAAASLTAVTGSASAFKVTTTNCRQNDTIAKFTASPASSCTLTITFTPTDLVAHESTLTVNSSATNGPLVVTLKGNGVALPPPQVAPLTLDFGEAVIGDSSGTRRQITISNSRTRAITYTIVDATDFKKATDACAGTVGGGTASTPTVCTIDIDFKPVAGTADGLSLSESIRVDMLGTAPDPNPGAMNVSVIGMPRLPLGLSPATLSPATVDGTPKLATVTLTNRGTTSLTLNTLLIENPDTGTGFATDYSRDATSTCANGTVLAPTGNPGTDHCSYVVVFNPPALAEGLRSAKLTITHSATGSPQIVNLRGVATPAPQGKIELDPTPLAFSDTQLGATSTLSRTIRNTGTLALNFSAFTLSGTNAAEFARGGDCSTSTPLPVVTSPGTGQCTLSITFRPADLDLRSASLTITSDASNGPATLAISGKGIPVPKPLVSLPTQFAFGQQTVGGLYPARSITLTNIGTKALTITHIAVTGAAFTIATSSTCTGTLAATASCNIDVIYLATQPNANDNGSLAVTSDAEGSPHSVALSGQGTSEIRPVLVWSPVVTTLDFGSTSVGDVSATQTVTVVNRGPGGAKLSLINPVGANAANFTVTGGTCTANMTLFEAAPGATSGAGTCTLVLAFAPGSGGEKNAALQVASSGSFPPTLALHGIGLSGPMPGFSTAPTALTFATTRVGAQSLPLEVLLSSSGSGGVTVQSLQASAPFSVQTKSCPAWPFTLAAGSSCTVTVTFNPRATGGAAGVLRISTDADPAVLEVAVSGQADAPTEAPSGGGCTIANGGGHDDGRTDPLLWAMVAAAITVLAMRRRRVALDARAPARKPPFDGRNA